jgi:hypothetical protein
MAFRVSKLKQPHELLNHILDLPDLPAILQKLDAGVLTKVIHHIGLEDSAQIVSLVSTDQLKSIFDEDLWNNQGPGQPEIFDAERFGLWLEILMESGPECAARKVMDLDESLVALGLCGLVRVKDRFAPALTLRDDNPPDEEEPLDRVWEGSLQQSFDHYLVIAKNPSRWDAVCALLAELNEGDDEKLTRLLEACCTISGEVIEGNGELFHVLAAEETLEQDLADEREVRRENKGFVTPASAAAFLARSRTTAINTTIAAKTHDPATRAYLAAMETAPAEATKSQDAGESMQGEGPGGLDLKVAHFVQTLQAAEILPPAGPKQLGYDGADSRGLDLPLTRAMRWIHQTDPALYSRWVTELSYLSNTLISGCALNGQPFKPKEAAEAALSVSNLGAVVLLGDKVDTEQNHSLEPLTDLLKTHHLIKLFQVGWKILFDNVVIYTAKAVLDYLNRIITEPADPFTMTEIIPMVQKLQSCILTGKPWEFCHQMDDLLIVLEGQTTMALKALMQEIPTLTDPLGKQEPNAGHAFITSKADIFVIRRYLREAL